jgi:hypothetical protein
MIGLRWIVVGARPLSGRFLAKAARLPAEIERSTEEHAQLLLSMIQARAPVRTGRYRASWHIERDGNRRVVTTSEPYGRRLEFGFYGTDSLGRHYNQAPQPHAMPAADAVETLYTGDMMIVATRGI